MIRICYRCNETMGEKEPFEDKSVTSGLCDPCFLVEMAEVESKFAQMREAGWLPAVEL